MPRLSLYKPEKGNDYKFIDRQISEMFQAGGTDIYLHKYLGPKNPTEGTADQPVYDVIKETNIQDLLFLENRDRKYESEIYKLRTIYAVQQTAWNLSQFGLFIDNDTVNISVHINDVVTTIGRKPMPGDVFELPHMKDLFALNDLNFGMPRYYVVEDVTLESQGYSVTWYPHLYRLKCKRIVDAQQFADILDKPGTDADGNPTEQSLREILSIHNKELEINDAIVQQAESDASKSGYETRQFYTLAVDPTTGKPVLNTADSTDINASTISSVTNALNASSNNGVPVRTGYTGYLVADGFPSNGYEFGFGIQFPESPIKDDFYLRTDFLPNRLFRFDGSRWVKVEDAVRMNMTNTDSRNTLKTSFINNSSYIYNNAVENGSDFVALEKGDYVIDTNINYTITAPFIEFKLSVISFGFKLSEHTPPMISNNAGKIRITLPVINEEQQVIPETGSWRITLCNNRDAERQSLSKVLKYKPEADV